MTDFLEVKDWEEHQTYRRDRNPPPWIKVHRRIFMSRKWALLSDAEKGHLISIWVLAADRDGHVPSDPEAEAKANTEAEKNTRSTGVDRAHGFDEFWEQVPRKVGKAKCLAIWKRRKLGNNLEPILHGLLRWKASDEWSDPKYIPHPSTWLNRDGWEDEPVEYARDTDTDAIARQADELIREAFDDGSRFQAEEGHAGTVLEGRFRKLRGVVD